MIKKSIRIISMVCSCLICFSALILLINVLQSLANIGNLHDGLSIFRFIIFLLIDAAFCVVSGFIGGFGIKAFICNEEFIYLKYYPIAFALLNVFLYNFVSLFFGGYANSTVWVLLILSVLLFLVLFGKYEKTIKVVLQFVGLGIVFVLTVMLLSYSSGLSAVFFLTNMFIIMGFIANDILVLVGNSAKSSKAKTA